MMTIVIPTKNESDSLPRLLASIKEQTMQPGEVIVADACSDDATREIATSFGAKVVEGGLPGVGRNNGAHHATKEIILFLDADVELQDKHFLEKTIGEMLERKLDIATCDVRPISNRFIDRVLHASYNRYARLCGSYIPHAPGFCIFVRKAVHEDIGGFDEEVLFAEDHDYARRAVSKRYRFGILEEVVPVSVRRLDRDGRLSIFIKYALGELHLIFIGPVRHARFRYSFGHNQKEQN